MEHWKEIMLTMCWFASHRKTASCSSSSTSGGTVPISVVFFISNVRFKKRYKSKRCASSSVDTSEKAVPCRPALAQRPTIQNWQWFISKLRFFTNFFPEILFGNETNRLDAQTTLVCRESEHSPRNPIGECRYHALRYLLQLTLTLCLIGIELCLFSVPMDPCSNRWTYSKFLPHSIPGMKKIFLSSEYFFQKQNLHWIKLRRCARNHEWLN